MAVFGARKGFADTLASLSSEGIEDFALDDGSRVAVIGGGPAGSLFCYFLLQMAGHVGLKIEVDVYEPRHFTHTGPAGCNHCGGVVSESLVQILAAEGINLPTSLVQRGIDSYMMHLDVGSVRIETPLHEKRIAALYRGNGPRDSKPGDVLGFDGYLLELAASMGANVVRKLVSGIERTDEGIRIRCPDGTLGAYDLVVAATGVNSRYLDNVEGLAFGFRAPEPRKAFICEFQLGETTIEEYFGTSMHVFLLDIPGLKFAALIPKGDLLTMCVLGEEIDEDLIQAFVQAPEVRQRFPGARVPRSVCHCFPRINVGGAARPFADRIVMIGDAATTRLYKDGIGAAYRTAKAAARTAIFHGVSEDAFRAHFWPTCRRLEFDNRIGKLIFDATRLIQKRQFLRRAVMRMTVAEQRGAKAPRMSGVLWDIFTGSAPYTDILRRGVHPVFTLRLMWNLAASLRPSRGPVALGRANRLRRGRTTIPSSRDRKAGPRTRWSNSSPLAPIQPDQMQTSPPCQAGCPNSGDIRGWIGAIAQHEKQGITLEEACTRAWERIVSVNPFPASLGRICPHPCEQECNRAEKDGAVAINAMERYLGDWAIERGMALPLAEETRRPESIGVIGGGPAGLSFAYQMARRGYEVTIYERRACAGGMLRYGIPAYRLPEATLTAEIGRIEDLGVEIKLETEVGRDVPLLALQEHHDALFLGVGAQRARGLNIPGEDGPGVWSGIAYLDLRKTGGRPDLGPRVAVIGGGNTAIDAARSARRDGADVVVLYRRTRAEMPAAESEIEDALLEGVRLEPLAAPTAIKRDEAGVRSVLVQRMRLGDPDASGRRRPLPIPGSEYELEVDSVLVAVSQDAEWDALGLFPPHGDADRAEKLRDRLWAGGDALCAGIAAHATAHGRIAAEALHAELRHLPLPEAPDPTPIRVGQVKLDYYEPSAPAQRPCRPASDRLAEPDLEVAGTISTETFLHEARRCLSCGLCFGCRQCAMYCNPIAYEPVQEAAPGAYFVLDLDRCEACAKCIELCPCGFLTVAGERDDAAPSAGRIGNTASAPALAVDGP